MKCGAFVQKFATLSGYRKSNSDKNRTKLDTYNSNRHHLKFLDLKSEGVCNRKAYL